MRFSAVIAGAALLGLASTAKAETTANDMMTKIDAGGTTQVLARLWISAASEGMSWANSNLILRKQTPVYCEPEQLALTTDQKVDIFRRFMAKHHAVYGRHPAGLALMHAMQSTFPCEWVSRENR